jgi:hypothetical protein
MATVTIETDKPQRSEPRWPAVLAILAVGGLYLALPEPLTPGPNWLLLALLAILHVPTIVSYRLGKTDLNRWFGVALSSLTTLFLIWSLALLIAGLPSRQESPTDLLRSASALWISNVLVFATWYWRLDAGGPNQRVLRDTHTEGAFLFPQMIPGTRRGKTAWNPGFVDYLFLAFNTSTAFSPTDVPVLSRWAKALMMVQSLISLSSIAVLAARAVNIL